MAKKPKEVTPKAVKEPKVEILPEARLCDICRKVQTHRLVNGVRICTVCLVAPPPEGKTEG